MWEAAWRLQRIWSGGRPTSQWQWPLFSGHPADGLELLRRILPPNRILTHTVIPISLELFPIQCFLDGFTKDTKIIFATGMSSSNPSKQMFFKQINQSYLWVIPWFSPCFSCHLCHCSWPRCLGQSPSHHWPRFAELVWFCSGWPEESSLLGRESRCGSGGPPAPGQGELLSNIDLISGRIAFYL